MTHPSKVKGNTFERELVREAQAVGLRATRAWGSNGQALGKAAGVDLVVGGRCLQAKRRRVFPKYLQPDKDCHAVVFRQDRGPTLVLLRWEDYLRCLATTTE